MRRVRSLKIGVSGVRGIVGETLSPHLVTTFSQAFGSLVGRGTVLVGRDTRTSGAMIEKAVVSGLLALWWITIYSMRLISRFPPAPA